MKPTSTFTKADLKQLEEFLLSDKTPDECMDISSLHGYLTALVIGPETVLPSKWMPDIWGAEVIWDDMEEAQNIFGLVMSFYNTIIKSVTSPANNFLQLRIMLFAHQQHREKRTCPADIRR